jgi:hypothetical protein
MRPAKYPFAAMTPGDSFFVPEDHIKGAYVLRAAIDRARIRHGGDYALQIEPGGYRVFRTV